MSEFERRPGVYSQEEKQEATREYTEAIAAYNAIDMSAPAEEYDEAASQAAHDKLAASKAKYREVTGRDDVPEPESK